MGGRGSRSRMATGGNGNGGVDISDWQEAFEPGVDFERSGDVDHVSRTVTRQLQRQWDQFTQPYNISQAEEDALMKDWDYATNELYGYLRTTNSSEINKALALNDGNGLTDAQIFTRRDRHGVLRDLQTVQTLDKAIANHRTQENAYYTRFCSPNSLKRTFGFSNAQLRAILAAGTLTQPQLQQLSKALSGSKSYSAGYTSTSANRSMNAFSNPNAPQSPGWVIERRVYTPKGTNAYAARRNAQESEVIFGRRMRTSLMSIEIARDGHIILNEFHDGYK